MFRRESILHSLIQIVKIPFNIIKLSKFFFEIYSYNFFFFVVDYLAHNPHLLQRRPNSFEDYHKPSVKKNVKYKLPPGLPKDLPPSLRPPPPTGYDFSYAAQWG